MSLEVLFNSKKGWKKDLSVFLNKKKLANQEREREKNEKRKTKIVMWKFEVMPFLPSKRSMYNNVKLIFGWRIKYN